MDMHASYMNINSLLSACGAGPFLCAGHVKAAASSCRDLANCIMIMQGEGLFTCLLLLLLVLLLLLLLLLLLY